MEQDVTTPQTSSHVVANWKLTKVVGFSLNSLAVRWMRTKRRKNMINAAMQRERVTNSMMFQKFYEIEDIRVEGQCKSLRVYQ